MAYEIKTYNLIGKNIETFKERPKVRAIEDGHGGAIRFIEGGGGINAITGPLSKFSTTKPKDGLDVEDFPVYLPYFADVIEDLPSSCTFEPRTYKNCQLMTETHGPYLQFYDFNSQRVLRIAINSNTYSPCL